MNENIEKIKEQISAYLDGELTQEETSRVEDLILNNKEWQQYYKELQGLQNVLTEWDDEVISHDLASKVQKSLLEQKLKEDIVMSKPSWMKQMAPTLTIATFVLVGLVAMQVYVKRGTQGLLNKAADDIGGQSSTGTRQLAGSMEKAYEPYALSAVGPAKHDGNKKAEKRKAVATGTGGMQNMAGRLMTSRPSTDTFKAGVTRSEMVADEVTTVMGSSRVLNTEQEFWGGGSSQVASVDRVRQVGGFQESSYGLAKNMPASAPVIREGKSNGVSYEPYYVESDYRKDRDQIAIYDAEESVYMPYKKEAKFNTENYDRIYENEFLTVDENPLSTFSIDVDTASYANLRRFLNQGQLPPKDSVRIEEMVNYFSYNYPPPQRGNPFSVTLKASQAPWNPNHQLVLVGLQGMKLQQNQIPPSNLVFLIDVSGSMNQANKLPLLKESFKMMVNQLGPNERVAIVVYAGAAGEVLPSTSGSNKQAILSAIDRLQAGGSTAGGAGIQLAYNIAKQNFIKGGNNRVILATDGDFNVGVSNNGDLIRMIEEKRNDGVFLTTLGFGTGNYKDSRMEQIANKGNGNHYYIDTNNEAKKVLVRELGSTLFTIAKDVKLQIEFNPAQVKAYRLIGYENRMLKKEDFNDDTKDAGELGAGHTVTALYEIVPADSAETFGTVDQLKYKIQKVISSDELLTVKLRYKKPDEHKSRLIQESIKMNEITVETGQDFKFASAVAEFGLILRDSRFKGQASFTNILRRANEAKGSDPFGYRAEFISLVQKAAQLIPHQDPGIDFKYTDPQPAQEGGMFFKGSQN